MTAPARIYDWQNSQLSIVRFYGGCNVHGAHYRIALNEPGTPLVRADVLTREAKAQRDAARAEKQTAAALQTSLLDPPAIEGKC